MQQTGTYKLNLIEPSDTFSPEPLNENTGKVEGALDGLDQRVTVLETHKIVTGYHPGTGTVDLGFTPKVVIANGDNGHGVVFDGRTMNGLALVEGGFRHSGYFSNCYYVVLV